MLSCSRSTGHCIANYRVCGRPVDGSDCGCGVCRAADAAAWGEPPAVDELDELLVEPARVVVEAPPPAWYELEEPRVPAWRRAPKWHPTRRVPKC